ncbi:SURF1 family protein [Bartonella sp. B17]
MEKINLSMTELKHKRISFSSILFGTFCICFFLIFSALGVWQIQRLSWKTNLIANANERVHLPPIEAPSQNLWTQVTFEKDEYLPVVITGKLLKDKSIFVIAVAQNTSGYWVLTPLQTADKTLTFINRGFIPMSAQHDFKNAEQSHTSDQDPTTDTEQTTIIGLLRMSEREGIFPRKNNPDRNLWHTRNLPAMAQKLGLSTSIVAPYFIDARKQTASQKDLPIAGLTVVHFRNNHLTYAITWFILAAGILGAYILLLLQKTE